MILTRVNRAIRGSLFNTFQDVRDDFEVGVEHGARVDLVSIQELLALFDPRRLGDRGQHEAPDHHDRGDGSEECHDAVLLGHVDLLGPGCDEVFEDHAKHQVGHQQREDQV